MPIVAAVFDAFGTVVHIRRKHHPFRKLLHIGAQQGRKPSVSGLHCLMTSSLSLERAAEVFGIRLSSQQLMALQDDLLDELESISVYADAVEAQQLLKAEGMVMGVCSNLAAPYGPVLRHLLNDMDGFALSYEVGLMKPHEGIYREICRQLGARLGSDLTTSGDKVVMVGDSLQCDQKGPRAVGISGHFLDRTGAGSLSDLVQFAERVIKGKRLGESRG
ncbi:HAD family hydrolase [Pseudomonas simiae]|jgi:HAD superfamily hydrolase (TIGR01549 family)|uniref:Haloacid dehalogenase n=1 Tax=Pseudomonas simiae TaxID=321846 RepID=A0A1N7U003_9PSED|nr:HAD-IA family hydrolase [Pseudomonas simiae]AIB37890.1 haloacid dehalogenase [Pseudomonas simiae]